jgi:hypothetical protein
LQDLLPAPCGGGPERDPAIEIDLLEPNERRTALRPPRIGQVLLRRVRDGARPQEEGKPAQPDAGCFQRPEGELAALVEHVLLDHLVRLQQQRLRNGQPQCFSRLEVDDQLEFCGLLDGQVTRLGAPEDLVHINGTAPEEIA